MRISDWSSDVCSSDLQQYSCSGIGKRAIKIRKTQVITNAKAHASPWHIDRYGMLTGIMNGRFAPAFALQIDVKQMHLVIAAADSPSDIDHEAAVRTPFTAFSIEPERADMNTRP